VKGLPSSEKTKAQKAHLRFGLQTVALGGTELITKRRTPPRSAR
jgi:hypothetical protein